MTHIALVLAATTAVQAFATLSVMALPAIAPAVSEALRVPASLVGLQVSLVYLMATLTSTVVATFIRRYGAARTSQAALWFSAAGCFLLAVPSLPVMAAGSAVIGIGYGLTNPSASHLLTRFFTGRSRNLIFSIKQTGVPIGGIAAGLVLPHIAVGPGWQWALVTASIPSIILSLLLILVRRRWDDDRDPSARFSGNPFGGMRLVWQSPILRPMALSGFSFAAVQLCLTSFVVTLLVKEVHFDLVTAGIAVSIIQLSGISGRLFWGWLADYLRNALLVLIAINVISIAGCIGTALLAPDWPRMAIYAVFAVFGLSVVGWNGVFIAEADRLSRGKDVGAKIGGMMAFTFSGVLFGPTAFTAAYSIIGSYSHTFFLAALVLVLGCGLLLRADKAAKLASSP